MVDGDTIVGGPRNISVDNVRKTSLAVRTDGGFGPHTLVLRELTTSLLAKFAHGHLFARAHSGTHLGSLMLKPPRKTEEVRNSKCWGVSWVGRGERVNLVDTASVQVRGAFRHEGCDTGENELESFAAIQVELGTAQVWE